MSECYKKAFTFKIGSRNTHARLEEDVLNQVNHSNRLQECFTIKFSWPMFQRWVAINKGSLNISWLKSAPVARRKVVLLAVGCESTVLCIHPVLS